MSRSKKKNIGLHSKNMRLWFAQAMIRHYTSHCSVEKQPNPKRWLWSHLAAAPQSADPCLEAPSVQAAVARWRLGQDLRFPNPVLTTAYLCNFVLITYSICSLHMSMAFLTSFFGEEDMIIASWLYASARTGDGTSWHLNSNLEPSKHTFTPIRSSSSPRA